LLDPEPGRQLLPVLPKPGSVRHTDTADEIGVRLWWLDNGAQVAFKRGRRGGREALLRILPAAPLPVSAAPEWRAMDWVYAPRLVEASGAGEHDASSLSQLLSNTSTKLQLGTSIDASSANEDLELTLQLVHLYITSPRRDPQAFESLQAQLREAPTPAQAFVQGMFPQADRRTAADRLSLDGALRAYQAQFGDASRLRFVLVGDVPEERARGLVEQYLVSLPGKPTPVDLPRSQRSKPASSALGSTVPRRTGVQHVRVSGRPALESQVVMYFSGTAVPSPQARVWFDALGMYLRRRLRAVLRETLGGVYDIELRDSWEGQQFSRELRFDCKPEDVDRLQRATREVIAGISARGISDADIAALRAEYLARFPAALESDHYWLDELTHTFAENADPQRIPQLHELSAQINTQALSQAARQFLPLDAYVDAVWSPQAQLNP